MEYSIIIVHLNYEAGANYCPENNMNSYNSKKIIKNNQNTTNRDIFI